MGFLVRIYRYVPCRYSLTLCTRKCPCMLASTYVNDTLLASPGICLLVVLPSLPSLPALAPCPHVANRQPSFWRAVSTMVNTLTLDPMTAPTLLHSSGGSTRTHIHFTLVTYPGEWTAELEAGVWILRGAGQRSHMLPLPPCRGGTLLFLAAAGETTQVPLMYKNVDGALIAMRTHTSVCVRVLPGACVS